MASPRPKAEGKENKTDGYQCRIQTDATLCNSLHRTRTCSLKIRSLARYHCASRDIVDVSARGDNVVCIRDVNWNLSRALDEMIVRTKYERSGGRNTETH